ncbi:MAG: 2Fe-2S iron-sulfur cluster-binding protein [Anaerolineales bacterium]|jgi:NADH dehydrogenase/NADH:ubiquinone oxidoreductase subunit G
MPDQVTLTIDDVQVTVPAGTTIMKAAEQAGIDGVPTICYHDACTSNGLCRICVVEEDNARRLLAACVTQAADGMKVHTRTERVERSRRTILEMLNAAVDLSDSPEIQDLMQEYSADAARLPDAERREQPVIDDNPMYIRDYSKCILCWRCVQVCAEDAQYTYAINFSGRGFQTQIDTFFQKPMLETTCVFCGQCVAVCPTGALKPKRQWLLEQGASIDEVMDMTRSQRRRKRRNADAGN